MTQPLKIDFIVIGAQKSGTTSLFNHLSSHPSIYMPQRKELRFFSHDFERGVDWYLSRYFDSAPASSVKGEASPHYMCFRNVPERIAGTFPDIKLIAVLRNPIARAFSHYQMTVRRKLESRTFLEAIHHEGSSLRDGQALDENFDYIRLGEYGCILAEFFNVFRREQILVGFMDDLETDPASFMQQVYQFLGVDANFVPPDIGQKFHEGGQERIPGLKRRVSKQLHRLKRYRWIGNYLTEELIASILFRIETQWNIKKGYQPNVTQEAHNYLLEHYRTDVNLLENLLGRPVPWKEFHT